MKRIILRYRDVEKLIACLQQKINTHADVLHAEEVFRTQLQRQQETIRGLEQRIKEMGGELARADKQVTALLAERGKLESENQRLSAVAEKLEAILLRKLQNHEQRNK
jgi:phage shock protein A